MAQSIEQLAEKIRDAKDPATLDKHLSSYLAESNRTPEIQQYLLCVRQFVMRGIAMLDSAINLTEDIEQSDQMQQIQSMLGSVTPKIEQLANDLNEPKR